MDEFLTETEAAERLRISRDTLQRMRARDDGPTWIRVGGGVRYPLGDLIVWLDENRRDGRSYQLHDAGTPAERVTR